MNSFVIYALAAPFNAFICCAFITFFMRKLKISPEAKSIITFLVYCALAFVISSGGTGILNITFDSVNWTLFALYVASGICVTMGIYVYTNRGTISQKILNKREQKNKEKK